MGDRIATVIAGRRPLMDEALASLMESHSYHVVWSVASTTDIDRGAFGDVRPEPIILAALTAEGCVRGQEQHPQMLAGHQDHHALRDGLVDAQRKQGLGGESTRRR